jgi:hypothetical protein
VDACLVGKGTETRNVVVEGDIDLYRLGNHVFNLLEHVELIFALDVVWVGDNHACHETAQGGDAVALANTNDGCLQKETGLA